MNFPLLLSGEGIGLLIYLGVYTTLGFIAGYVYAWWSRRQRKKKR